MDVIGIQETLINGCGVIGCMVGNESEVWEGMEGGVVWCGVDEKGKGREKEGCVCTPNVSEDMTKHAGTVHGWKGSRILCKVGKVGIVKYAWVCMYVKSRKGKVMRIF